MVLGHLICLESGKIGIPLLSMIWKIPMVKNGLIGNNKPKKYKYKPVHSKYWLFLGMFLAFVEQVT